MSVFSRVSPGRTVFLRSVSLRLWCYSVIAKGFALWFTTKKSCFRKKRNKKKEENFLEYNLEVGKVRARV